MLPAARVGGDVPLIDAGGGLAAGRGRVSRLPRMTPQSSSNIFKDINLPSVGKLTSPLE